MIYNIHHLDNLQNDMANDMESWVLSIVEVRGEKLLIEWNMFSGMRESDLPNISLHALKLKRSTPFEDLSSLFRKEHKSRIASKELGQTYRNLQEMLFLEVLKLLNEAVSDEVINCLSNSTLFDLSSFRLTVSDLLSAKGLEESTV